MLSKGTELGPGIVVYENIIDNCQEIIDFAKSNPLDWKDSEIGHGVIDKEVRSADVFYKNSYYDTDIIWFQIAKTIWKYADEYGKEYDAPFSSIEPIQMLHYSPNTGFYIAHADSGPGVPRIFSAVLYLNDVEDGGETYFNYFDISVTPKAGRLILFPANYMYKHEAKPLSNSDKYVIVTWFQPIF